MHPKMVQKKLSNEEKKAAMNENFKHIGRARRGRSACGPSKEAGKITALNIYTKFTSEA